MKVLIVGIISVLYWPATAGMTDADKQRIRLLYSGTQNYEKMMSTCSTIHQNLSEEKKKNTCESFREKFYISMPLTNEFEIVGQVITGQTQGYFLTMVEDIFFKIPCVMECIAKQGDNILLTFHLLVSDVCPDNRIKFMRVYEHGTHQNTMAFAIKDLVLEKWLDDTYNVEKHYSIMEEWYKVTQVNVPGLCEIITVREQREYKCKIVGGRTEVSLRSSFTVRVNGESVIHTPGLLICVVKCQNNSTEEIFFIRNINGNFTKIYDSGEKVDGNPSFTLVNPNPHDNAIEEKAVKLCSIM